MCCDGKWKCRNTQKQQQLTKSRSQLMQNDWDELNGLHTKSKWLNWKRMKRIWDVKLFNIWWKLTRTYYILTYIHINYLHHACYSICMYVTYTEVRTRFLKNWTGGMLLRVLLRFGIFYFNLQNNINGVGSKLKVGAGGWARLIRNLPNKHKEKCLFLHQQKSAPSPGSDVYVHYWTFSIIYLYIFFHDYHLFKIFNTLLNGIG